MATFEKIETLETPHILFDSEKGELLIEGKSFPPDVVAFYRKALDWINEYSENPKPKTKLILKLDYFNTASSKIIMDILYKMEELYKNGNDVLVEWYYPEDDEDMKETGEEYAELIDVPFKTIGYKFMIE